jgi:CheY-like chemotaxis protein
MLRSPCGTSKRNRITNKVIHLWDGQEALDYLFRQGKYSDPELSPVPHLILLDLRLPKVDGLEVLEKNKVSRKPEVDTYCNPYHLNG